MSIHSVLPIGLIQINSAGEILYFQPEMHKGLNSRPYPLVGQNLFNILLMLDPTRNSEEELKRFINSRESIASFDCEFRTFEGTAPVKMVVARIPPQPDGPAIEVVIINFRMNEAAEEPSTERRPAQTMAVGRSENEAGPLLSDLGGEPQDLPPTA
jgi:PAS domain-containing protein